MQYAREGLIALRNDCVVVSFHKDESNEEDN